METQTNETPASPQTELQNNILLRIKTGYDQRTNFRSLKKKSLDYQSLLPCPNRESSLNLQCNFKHVADDVRWENY